MFWVPFYFDGNQGWGWCATPDEFKRIVLQYANGGSNLAFDGNIDKVLDFLLTALKATYSTTDRPNFGLYSYVEHKGPTSLRDFLGCNEVDIKALYDFCKEPL